MKIELNGKEYNIKFGYKPTLKERIISKVVKLGDVTGMGKIKELFSCVRDLLFVGFKKLNPVETVQEIGEILDDYHDDAPDGEKRGIIDLFTQLTEELMNEGFLGDLMEQMTKVENTPKVPQDHKKPQK